MYEVFLTNMGYNQSHSYTDSAIPKAPSTGFTCPHFQT